ncbi:hypothetical protein L596_000984 [Steinernema carpocapsae]|uniref:SMP-LTD domain-containing protein n=1 Tax=Steinernema carpocapsae TaxID=34508 RepID=A0A4U8UKF8_STECR|nr:hypothetical protein L596_000984 [Steinernema carpocapsae]
MVEEQPAEIHYGPPPPVPPRSTHRERVTPDRRSITFDGSALLTVRMADIAGDSDEYDNSAFSVQRPSLSASASSRDVTMHTIDSYDKFTDSTDDVSASLSASNPSLHVNNGKMKKKRISGGIEVSDRDSVSVGSNDSSREPGKLASLLDKAKNKGKKLVARSKKNKTELVDEGLQVSIDPETLSQVSVASIAQSCTPSVSSDSASNGCVVEEGAPVSNFLSWTTSFVNVKLSDKEPEQGGQSLPRSLAARCRTMPFFQYRMAIFVGLIAFTWIWPSFIVGIIWGVYISFNGFLYFFVSEPLPQYEPKTIPDDVMKEVTEDYVVKKTGEGRVVYKGWMNELRGRYSSLTYHVNQAQTVLVRLDGSMLRISRPERSVLKHSFHTDPTLTEPEPKLVGQSIYDLTDARVSLRPKRLAKRRWWSRKYPIYIRLASRANIVSTSELKTVLSRSSTDHNVSGGRGVQEVEAGSATTGDIVNLRDGDEGYDPEESSEDERSSSVTHVTRANSTGDLNAFAEMRVDKNAQRSSPCRVYLFVRSAREKERWFHRLREACSQYRQRPNMMTDPTDSAFSSSSFHGTRKKTRLRMRLERTMSLPYELDDGEAAINLEYLQYMSNHLQFLRYLSDVLGTDSSEKSRETGTVMMDLGRNKWTTPKKPYPNDIVMAVNLLATRIFFDFCRDDYWVKAVRDKIQTKLATIHLPYFIETLELSSLDLGTQAPQIVGVYAPIVDQWGLWTDFEMKYQGGIRLVLETRVNLMKLKSGGSRVAVVKKACRLEDSSHLNRYSDEDIPESPESSPDEDFGSKTSDDKAKFLNFLIFGLQRRRPASESCRSWTR